MLSSTLKPKPCAHCKALFTPARLMQSVCSPVCAARKVKQDKAEERAKIVTRKQAAKTRAQWLAECQAIVNKIARLRDRQLPCVSCDRPAIWDGQWHGSHLRSVGAASAVRFNLWNVHKACSICNNHLSGNIAEYLPRVRARIGDEKVDWLFQQNKLVKHDIPYLTRFKAVMGKKLRRMEKRIEREVF